MGPHIPTYPCMCLSHSGCVATVSLLSMVAESDSLALELRVSGGWDDISSVVAGNLDVLRNSKYLYPIFTRQYCF